MEDVRTSLNLTLLNEFLMMSLQVSEGGGQVGASGVGARSGDGEARRGPGGGQVS